MTPAGRPEFPEFDRHFLESPEEFTVIGSGELGGKALGLARIKRMLAAEWQPGGYPDFQVGIPRLTVLATDSFDRFMLENGLWDVACSDASDDRIAHAFLKASLPAAIVGDLRGLIERVRQPLAVRSSSLLEDDIARPFAGVYATKMIPNNQLDAESRFHGLTEAIKFVFASTFFAGARAYRAATGASVGEKMAVVIQEVLGRRHGDRFYPDISGVARSWNYYAAGYARPEDGTVALALGLGKTIVDGGVAWNYSPTRPHANPPVASARDLLRQTQTRFWAVGMAGRPVVYDPVAETEYLVEADLQAAEEDAVLGPLASTYEPNSDRLSIGTGAAGARVLTFAPLLVLEKLALNDIVRAMLALAEQAVGAAVEIEFALTIEPGRTPPARFGFLQARPMRIAVDGVEATEESLAGPEVIVASESVLGHGVSENLADVVYVRPERFDLAHTREIAQEIALLNRGLAAAGRHFLLIGFGRWGSSDPWLGIPVGWAQISEARAIVEASLPQAQPDPSQGSHFFHNLMSLGVPYFTVRHTGPYAVDWPWLDAQAAVTETAFVRHVRFPAPLRIEADARTGRGVIRRGGSVRPGGTRS